MWAKVNQRVTNQQYEKQNKHKIQSQQSDSQNLSQNSQRNHLNKNNKQYSYSDSEQQNNHNSSEHSNSSDNQQDDDIKQRQNISSSSSSQSQQSDNDSLQYQNKHKANKLQSLRQESNQQEQSIDYIEERIRKLQRDLQDRLDKHKTKIKQKTITPNPKKNIDSQQPGKIVSIRKQPPVPPKKKQIEQDNSASLPETQINFKTKQKPTERQDKGNDKQHQNKKQTPYETIINKKKHVKQNNSDLSNIPKKVQSSQLSSPTKGSKKRIKSSITNLKSQIQPTKVSTIQKDFKKLNKQIGDLKKQNKNLKQQLNYYKKKKRPIEQIQKLKQLSQHDTKKLQKELELLKVLQRLQNKLKNSIEKKLGKGSAENKQTKQVALLHKGLPSNILN